MTNPTPVQLSDERLRFLADGLPVDDTYAGFPRKTSIYTFELRALVTELQHSRAEEAVALPADNNALAQMCEDFQQGSVAFANDPDEFHHLIEFTPPQLREFVATLSASPASPSATGVRVKLTAYEAQVLIGTSISGSAMPPDRVFDLPAAWSRLHSLGLIDRTDGLAVATPEGVALVATLLSAIVEQP